MDLMTLQIGYSSIISALVEFLHQLAGTDSNPFSLDALAVFMFRVLQRVNHPVLNCLSFNYNSSVTHHTPNCYHIANTSSIL